MSMVGTPTNTRYSGSKWSTNACNTLLLFQLLQTRSNCVDVSRFVMSGHMFRPVVIEFACSELHSFEWLHCFVNCFNCPLSIPCHALFLQYTILVVLLTSSKLWCLLSIKAILLGCGVFLDPCRSINNSFTLMEVISSSGSKHSSMILSKCLW